MKINQRYHFDEDYVINVEPMMKTAIDNKRAAEEAEKRRLAEAKDRYDATIIVENMINTFINHFLTNPGKDSSIYTNSDLLAHLDEEEVARYIVFDLKANASVPDDIIIGAAISIGNKLGHRTSSRIYKIATEIERIANSSIIDDTITTYTNPLGDGFYTVANSDCPNALAGVQLLDSSHLNGSMSGIAYTYPNDRSMSDAAYRRYIDDTYYGNTQEVN